MKNRFKFALGLIGLLLFCTLSYSQEQSFRVSPTIATLVTPSTSYNTSTASLATADVFSSENVYILQVALQNSYALANKQTKLKLGTLYRPYSVVYSYPVNSTLQENLVRDSWRNIKASLNERYHSTFKTVSPNL